MTDFGNWEEDLPFVSFCCHGWFLANYIIMLKCGWMTCRTVGDVTTSHAGVRSVDSTKVKRS